MEKHQRDNNTKKEQGWLRMEKIKDKLEKLG